MRIQAKYLHGLLAALLVGVASSAASAPGPVDTRLVTAAEKQDKTAIQSLLQNGAYVGGVQPDGTTALHWAVHWGDLESAELLMLFGADLNAKNDYGATPLSVACEASNAAMVEKLVAKGADPNLASPSGETPLMLCARTGRSGGEVAHRAQSERERQGERGATDGVDVGGRAETRGRRKGAD
jgi:hypothetical protein